MTWRIRIRLIALLTQASELVVHGAIANGGENTSINEPECIPLSRTLSLEVPPKPALGLRLKGGNLGLNITPGVVFV